MGSALLLGAFVVSCALFLGLQPQVPGTDVLLTPPAALVVAVCVTLWIVLPLVVLSLRLAHDWLPPDSGGGKVGS